MPLLTISWQHGPAGAVVFICALGSLCAALLLSQTMPERYAEAPAVSFRHGVETVAPPPARAEPGSAAEREPAYRLARVTVEGNFLLAVSRAGVSAAVASMLVNAFAHEVDFRRDLKRGNVVKFIFGQPGDDAANAVDAALPLAVRIELSQRTHEVFLFRDRGGRASYRAEQAPVSPTAPVPAMSRFPLDFVRISSPFSLRRLNPVTRRWQAHDGVDLAAPTGTPVRATADGIIAFIGGQTGYGNVVKLRNAVPYSTTFAHLSRFADGLRTGSTVRRGDVIGYVGSTGHSTGPHLHYEVRENGVPRNPLTVSPPTTEPIRTADIGRFVSETGKLAALF